MKNIYLYTGSVESTCSVEWSPGTKQDYIREHCLRSVLGPTQGTELATHPVQYSVSEVFLPHSWLVEKLDGILLELELAQLELVGIRTSSPQLFSASLQKESLLYLVCKLRYSKTFK